MGNAHLNDILMRMESKVLVDHQRTRWVISMTDPVSCERYYFKYDSDCYTITNAKDALRRAMTDFNNIWNPQNV